MNRFLPAVLLLAAACGPTPREFPVGFYGVRTPEDARLLAAKGYNAFMVSGELEPLAALRRAAPEALLLASPMGALAAAHPSADFGDVVWYLQDEPEIWGVDNAELKALEVRVKAWAPGAKTAFVVGDGNKAKDYPGTADFLMVDWYPVPHLPLESAGDHVKMASEAAGARTVWAVLQAMDWRDFPQRETKKPRIGRFPDLAEIRFMCYDAILNGARGVWFYAYAPVEGKIQSPEHLFAVDAVAGELRTMAPVFAHGREFPAPFSAEGSVRARAWAYRGRDYVLLANRGKEMQRLPDAALASAWWTLFEPRRDPREVLKKDQGGHYLRPFQVLVLAR